MVLLMALKVLNIEAIIRAGRQAGSQAKFEIVVKQASRPPVSGAGVKFDHNNPSAIKMSFKRVCCTFLKKKERKK